jgi:hypothetical protein
VDLDCQWLKLQDCGVSQTERGKALRMGYGLGQPKRRKKGEASEPSGFRGEVD